MSLEYKFSDIIRGGLIYSIGDTMAVLISNEFDISAITLTRVLGILIIGATIYAFEIPNYFNWIDKKAKRTGTASNALVRASFAMLYFNPLWIARHMLFIELLLGNYGTIQWSILIAGLISFAINSPVSLIANYLIQNKISAKHRFLASALFSGLMAIYYSLSNTWFN